MEYPLELIVPRINYLDINELFQQKNVIFGRLLSALNIDRRHISGSHAIARLKFSRRVNSNTPSNFILPGLGLPHGITTPSDFVNHRSQNTCHFHARIVTKLCGVTCDIIQYLFSYTMQYQMACMPCFLHNQDK